MGWYARAKNEAALAALKDMQRDMRTDVKNALLGVANDVVVPGAKVLAPTIVRGSIIARATTRNAYLTTSSRGRNRRIFGYLNFGGTVKQAIRPKRARALRMPDGSFVAVVNTPRKFAGMHFLERSVDGKRAVIEREVASRVQAALVSHMGRTR